MRNFTVKTLNEFEKNGKYYALLAISIGDSKAFCIFACDGESVLEGLGSEEEQAKDMFLKIVRAEASIIQIGEIISDMKYEIFA